MAEEEVKYSFEIIESAEKSAGKNFWSISVTTIFLDLYKQYTPLLSKHRVQSFYEVLATKLEEATGITRSTRELQKKFSNLSRTYRNCLKKDSQKHEKFPFFLAMDEILQQEQPTGDPPEHLENDLNFLRVEEIENGTYIAAEPNFFPKKEVQALIHLYAKEKIVCDAKLIDWNKISSEHRKSGYNRSPKECRLKMHNLLRSYKSCVNNNVAPNRCKFVYFSDIKAIFNNNEYYIDSYKEYEQGQASTDQVLILDGSSWTEEETLALEVYHKETDDFTAISGRLEQAGFPERSPKEIQEKWDSLNTADDSLQVDRGNKRILIDLKEVFPEEVIVEEVQEEVVEFKHSFNWTSKETRQLVDIYKKLDGSVKPAERWEEISNCMKTRNVFKSSTECAKKWYNLVRSYRLCRQKFLETGNRPHKFFYFDDFQQIYKDDTTMLDPATLKRYVKKKIYNLTAEEIETQLIEECVGNIEEIPLEHRESGIYVDVMVVEWNYKAVEMMISCHQSYFDTTDENEHWNFICEELEKNGFFRFTPEECKIKWMELEEEYHKCITEDDREKFRFYNLMHMVLKESDKENPTEISKEKTIDMIRIKNEYSVQMNLETLPDDVWKNIADELDLNMTPESLSAYYNELYGNYQTFKEMQQNGANLDVDFGYFQEFDEIYGDDFQDYEVVEEIIPENIHIKQEIIQVVEQKREVNEDQLHAIADNFMTTCKFCLKQNKEEHLKAVTEDVAEKINYVLHENSPKLVLSISNLICSSCYVNIDHMYLYKKQYAENLGVLKDFSDKFSIESSSVNESNLTNEYEILEENFNEEEIEVQPVKVKLVKRLQQVKSRPRKKRKMN